MTEDTLITLKVAIGRKSKPKNGKIVVPASKKSLLNAFQIKKFPTSRLMHQLYQDDIDQVWLSSAKKSKEPLNFWAKSTKKKKVGKNVG